MALKQEKSRQGDGRNPPQLRVVHKKNGRGFSNGKVVSLGDIAIRKKNSQERPPGLAAFVLDLLYKSLYVLGVTMLRRCLYLRRRVRRGAVQVGKVVLKGLTGFGIWLLQLFQRVWQAVKAPVVQIQDTYRETAPQIRVKRDRGEHVFSLYLDILHPVFRLLRRVVTTAVNHALPVLAVILFVQLVYQHIDNDWVLQVHYNGIELGYIENEAQFEEAVQDVKNRVIGGGNDQTAADYTAGVPSFTLVQASGKRLTTISDLADRILEAHGTELEEAHGLYIDGTFYGAVSESASQRILDELEALMEEQSIGLPNEKVAFEKSIKFDSMLYPVSSLVDVQELSELLHSYEAYNEFYEVQANDTPSGIADKLGIAYSRLIEMNPGIEEGLWPGDEILTTVARPFLSVKNIYTSTYTESYAYETVETETMEFVKGVTRVDQEGVDGERRVTAEITTINGLETERKILEREIIKEAVPKLVTVGINDPTVISTPSGGGGSTTSGNTSGTSGTYIPGEGWYWPAAGGYISSYLNGYPGHTGIDIAGTGGVGSPIYASRSGVVTKVRSSWTGYGLHMYINHGDGFETLYAHCSAMYVSEGQVINKGDLIGAVGRTGNVTGPHLHFEVRYNGRTMNPINYIGRR